ncbi:MAG: 4Fe-4S dicluster-binding protein [Candidatus Loosdrechtia sp.]|uniref:4Fe-4S dicluster-binding protein n=1 Tax=Candidatus Loosdrechtia sp. TaxID=3101272 RepID=UPI003A609742|nr:MAG: 4Fe-4S binding protein [Candidatus Jettenia sp. AMX2]
MYVVAVVDEEKCVGCKMCIQACPEPNAIRFIVERKKAFVTEERCKGCALCKVECPKLAISLKQSEAVAF